MSDNNTIAVQIRVGTDGLVDGLRVAVRGVDGAAQSMRTSLRSIGEAAHETHSPIEGVTEHIRGMRTEMRLGNFMAAQIAEMGIAAKSTAAEVTGLFSAFALGGGVGLAIEGVKLLVKEILAGDTEIRTFADDAVKSLKALQEQVDGYLASMRGATEAEKLQHKEIGPLLRREADLKQDLIKLNIKAADAAEEAKEAEKKGRTAALQLALNERDSLFDEINKKQKLLDITKEQIDLATKTIKPLGKAEDTKAAQAAADKEQAIDDALYAHKIRLMEEHYKQRQKLLQEIDKAEGDSAKTVERFLEHLAEVRAKETIRREKIEDGEAEATKRRTDKLAKDIEHVGQQVTSAVLTMIENPKRAAQAALGLVKSLVADVLNVLIKTGAEALAEWIIGAVAETAATRTKAIEEVTQNAGIAGSAAVAASVAELGPFAIPYGEMIAGAVLASFLPMASAAGGYDIPAGINPLVQAHAEETVLPAPLAAAYRRGAELLNQEGGGGAGGMTVHVHAMDAQSFRDWLRTPEASSALADWQRGAQRSGRIP